MGFDIYDPYWKYFLNPKVYQNAFKESGFSSVPIIYQGKVDKNLLIELRDGDSVFSANERKEGIYIKVADGDRIVKRYKMVRKNFIQGEHWNRQELIKNKCVKENRNGS